MTVSQASAVAVPGVPGPGMKGFKAELGGLRERVRGLGFSYDEVAAEVSRRCQVRPREAYRLAWGLTRTQAAERFNDRAAREGTDPTTGVSRPHEPIRKIANIAHRHKRRLAMTSEPRHEGNTHGDPRGQERGAAQAREQQLCAQGG